MATRREAGSTGTSPPAPGPNPLRTTEALLGDAVFCPISTPPIPPTTKAATRASAGVRNRVQLFVAVASVAADSAVGAVTGIASPAGGSADAGEESFVSVMVDPFG